MKKGTKKLLSVVLTMVMLLAMMVIPTAAAGDYEIYQIFTGEYSNGILSNVKWGQNGTGTAGETVDDNVLANLEQVRGKTDAERLDMIRNYVNLESDALNVAPDEVDGSYTYTGLTPGYYLIKDAERDNPASGEPYTLYVVQVTDGTLTFTPKTGKPESDKDILICKNEAADHVHDEACYAKENNASIGDTINYVITGTLPERYDDYATYYYEFVDTLHKGLSFQNNIKIVAVNPGGNQDITGYFNISTKEVTEGTEISIGVSDLRKVPYISTATEKILVTYSAVLNEGAVIGTEAGNDNDVYLKYSMDPNFTRPSATPNPSATPEPSPTPVPTSTPIPERTPEPSTTPTPIPTPSGEPTEPIGQTPEKTVTTYTTELKITKHDQNGKVLTGAEFTLSGEGVNTTIVKGEVFVENENGTFYKLKDGKYTETAPTDDTMDSYESATKYSKETQYTVKQDDAKSVNAVGFVDANGVVTFTGLGEGTYTITETVTPDGYNTIDPIEVVITFNRPTTPDGKPSFTVNTDESKVSVDDKGLLSTTIVNQRGSLLPSTGGIGTTIFYVVGAVLVIGAGVLLVTKKRMSRAE